MTAWGPAITSEGTTEPAEHLGWNGIPFMMDRAYSEKLEFAHLFNTVVPSVYPSSSALSAADATAGDHSWNGRHASRFLAAPGTSKFTSSSTEYYDLAMTGAEFWDIGEEITMLAVANYPNTGGNHAIGNMNSFTIDGFAIGMHLTGGNNYHAGFWYASETDTFVTVNANSWRGTGIEFLALTVDASLGAKLYNWNPVGQTMAGSSLVTLPAAPGGDGTLRVGRSITTSFVSATDIAAVFGFSKAYSSAELTVLFNDLRTFFATYGITVL